LKQSILFRSVLVFHILPKDLDRCSTCRDDAVARGPQHGLAPISSAQCWKLRTQTPRCNGLEVVDEVRWSHTRRHVQQSVDMIGLTRALQECFPPPHATHKSVRIALHRSMVAALKTLRRYFETRTKWYTIR
jgi:hypothetical protein